MSSSSKSVQIPAKRSEIIKYVQKEAAAGNVLSIWDPCPQALSQHNKPTPAAIKRATLAGAYVEGKPKIPLQFLPNFISTTGNCNSWVSPKEARDEGMIRKVKERLVPKESLPETKFRFITIIGGPPGSGKTNMTNNMIKDCRLINRAAASKSWISLGHDQIMCMDKQYSHVRLEFCKNKVAPLLAATKAESPRESHLYDTVLKSINSGTGEWAELMEESNNLYAEARVRSRDGKDAHRAQSKKERGWIAFEIYSTMVEDKSWEKEIEELNNILTHIDGPKESNIGFPGQKMNSKKRLEFARKIILTKYTTLHAVELDNDLLLYVITCFCIRFGVNITYETTLKDKISCDLLIEFTYRITAEMDPQTKSLQPCRRFNYIFLLAFSIVNVFNLRKRLLDRFFSTSLGCDTCSNVAGFPQIATARLISTMENAYLVAASLIYNCISPPPSVRTHADQRACEGFGIDFLYFFDNDGVALKTKHDRLHISERSYAIGRPGITPRPMSINHKRAAIAILMNSLNCVETIKRTECSEKQSCGLKKCDSESEEGDYCMGGSCFEICSSEMGSQESLEELSTLLGLDEYDDLDNYDPLIRSEIKRCMSSSAAEREREMSGFRDIEEDVEQLCINAVKKNMYDACKKELPKIHNIPLAAIPSKCKQNTEMRWKNEWKLPIEVDNMGAQLNPPFVLSSKPYYQLGGKKKSKPKRKTRRKYKKYKRRSRRC